MGSVVAEDLDPLRRVARYDGNRGVAIDDCGEIARPAVDTKGDRCLGKPRPDRRGEVAPVIGARFKRRKVR
jgi:hypothetical protein